MATKNMATALPDNFPTPNVPSQQAVSARLPIPACGPNLPTCGPNGGGIR